MFKQIHQDVEKKSKEFHFAKARDFYKQWTDAEAELEKLKPETEELERQLAARRERRRSLQAASPPTSPS